MNLWLVGIALAVVVIGVVGYFVRRWGSRPEEAGKPMVMLAVLIGVVVSLGLILLISR